MSSFASAIEHFDDEEFEIAVTSLTKALEETDDNTVRAKILEKRADAHLHLSMYETAAEDASASLTLSTGSQGSYMIKGEALFNLDEYESAKSAFEVGLAIKGNSGKKAPLFQRWIRKCAAEIEEEEEEEKEEEEEEEEEKKGNKKEHKETPAATTPAPQILVAEAPKPTPKFRHDWYQTADMVVITVMAKKQKSENVVVDITETNLVVEIKLDDGTGSSFVLDLNLFDEVDSKQSTHRLSAFKLEVKLRKKESYQWAALEASDSAMAGRIPTSSSAVGSGSSTTVPSAYTSKKDWNAIERQIKKDEEEEKPEGEEALNALFRQIYGNASEETRRAMNKSFQTSGGTVLSTNWDEVGEKDYEKDLQAPEGMEWKNWNGEKLDKEGNPIQKN